MVNLAQRIGQEFKSVRDNEITNLQAADVTLQGNIDTEASTRATADSTLQANIVAAEAAAIATAAATIVDATKR